MEQPYNIKFVIVNLSCVISKIEVMIKNKRRKRSIMIIFSDDGYQQFVSSATFNAGESERGSTPISSQ